MKLFVTSLAIRTATFLAMGQTDRVRAHFDALLDAANQGDPGAQNELGVNYAEGNDVTRNQKQAVSDPEGVRPCGCLVASAS
jgi:hypothetical protein